MSLHHLDVRRLLCPLPVIRTQDKIKSLTHGDQLKIIGTDPGMLQDIPIWCRMNGHRLLNSQNIEGEFIIILEVIN
jgi:tRNA 2-thiouridine synthesizing protein A